MSWEFGLSEEGWIATDSEDGAEAYLLTEATACVDEPWVEFRNGSGDEIATPISVVAELMRRHGWTVTPPPTDPQEAGEEHENG